MHENGDVFWRLAPHILQIDTNSVNLQVLHFRRQKTEYATLGETQIRRV